jgi:hypothetical protein
MALRERWTLVPEAPPDSTAMHDIESCAQCGFPVRSDAPFCGRCGYRQSGSLVVPPVRSANGPAPKGDTSGAERTPLPGTRGRPRPPKVI